MKSFQKHFDEILDCKNVTILITEAGDVFFPGHDFDYDLSMVEFGEDASPELQMHKLVTLHPAGFIIEFMGLPKKTVVRFLLDCMDRIAIEAEKWLPEVSDVIRDHSNRILQNLSDEVKIQKTWLRFITHVQQKRKNASYDFWDEETGGIQKGIDYGASGSLHKLINHTQDIFMYISYLLTGQPQPMGKKIYESDIPKTILLIASDITSLRQHTKALELIGRPASVSERKYVEARDAIDDEITVEEEKDWQLARLFEYAQKEFPEVIAEIAVEVG